MDDYIKREAVFQIISDAPRLYLNDVIRADTIRQAVKKLPAADVRENVRGEWILFGDGESAKAKCDQCGFEICVTCEGSDSLVGVKAIISQYIFCPYCGTRRIKYG